MTKAGAVRGALIGMSVSVHGISAFEFARELPRTDVPRAWTGEFSILLVISLVVSLCGITTRSPRIRNTLMGVQLVLLILVGIPEGTSLSIETALTSLLIVQCIVLIALPWNLVFFALTSAIMIAIQTADVTFIVPEGKPPLPALLTFGTTDFLIGGITFAVSRLLPLLDERDRLIERLDSTIARLTDANVSFQRYATEVENQSVAKERLRVSREIHDTVGYTITTLIMLMEAASDLADSEPQQLKALLNQGIDQAISSLDEIRRSLRELRAMEVPRIHGLRAIKKMLRAFEDATHIRVKVDFSNVEWNFDEETNEVFYRMIQESLANAFRHGAATEVAVVFSQNNGEVCVSIRDNGKGSTEIHEGIGLSGMRERIERVGGRLSAVGAADGFTLSAVVPSSYGNSDHGT